MEEDVTQVEKTGALGKTLPADGLPPGPVVKICGLTRAEDVRLAADSGAWALGFVFAPSPRRVTEGQVAEFAAEVRRSPHSSIPRPLIVGVFGDVSPDEIARTVVAAGLDAVQLHGRSAPRPGEVRRALEDLASGTRLDSGKSCRVPKVLMIQAVAVDPAADDPEELQRQIVAARSEADLVLLDTSSRGRFGGTGTAFPWDLARAADDGKPFLIAGGIGPDNAGEAVSRSGAWGVDVSSGVESSPGVKDAQAVRKLVEVVNDIRRPRESGPVDARLEGSTK
jgi:phosphoribosylanthranilate isomerase